MKKLNLEVGRIRGWLKDPVHAAEELDISVEEATEYWNSSFELLPSNLATLLPNFSVQPIEEPIEENFTESQLLPESNTEIYPKEMIEVFASGSLF
jgi:hypothetical protein